jgi:peptidoglycan glycosyltransferase
VPPEVVPPFVLARLRAERPFAGRRLSIDLAASLLARDALRGNRGSILLLDATSGDVLAAVSDARTWAGGGTPALEERREPASIAKLLTTSAALRAGFDPDAAIAAMRCRGAIRLDGELLYCSSIDGPLRGLEHALGVSCNVAFAELGLLVGGEALREEYRRFGFALGDEPGHPHFGRVHRSQHDPLGLANLAIGLDEADITPLHAASMAAALARGDLLVPRLLHAVDGRLGLSPQPLPSRALDGAPSRPGLLSRGSRLVLHRAMAAVVSGGGTAAHVAPHGFPVIMKTGTGRDPGRYFHVNYIGAGPASDPEIAFAVRLTDGRTSRRVRRAAYETTRRLLAALGATDRGRQPDAVTLTEQLAPPLHDDDGSEARTSAGVHGGVASAGQ